MLKLVGDLLGPARQPSVFLCVLFYSASAHAAMEPEPAQPNAVSGDARVPSAAPGSAGQPTTAEPTTIQPTTVPPPSSSPPAGNATEAAPLPGATPTEPAAGLETGELGGATEPGVAAGTADGAAEPLPSAGDDASPGLFEAAVAQGGTPDLTEDTSSPAADATDGEATIGALHFGLHGHVRGDMYVGKTVGYLQPEIKNGYGEAALKLDLRAGSRGRAFADTRLRFGYDGEEMVTVLNVREAYADVYAGPVDLRLGQQIIVWGRADGINPTNVLTPIDMRIRSPNEDDRRLGNVGLRMFLNFQPLRIEGVWMPLYVPTQWPAIDIGDDIQVVEPNFPDTRLAHGLGAGRVHLELPKFEMSGSYVYGHAPLPGLTYEEYDLLVDPPVVRIARTAYQHHVAGVDFSTAIGDILGLRGEAAYRHPPEYKETLHTPNPDLQYVVGLDREFGNVTLIAQYYGRYVFDWQELPEPQDDVDLSDLAALDQPLTPLLDNMLVSHINDTLAIRNRILHAQTKPVQHAISMRAEWKALHERLSLSAFGMVNVSTLEWLVYPKVAYRVTDAIITSLGAEIYMGPPDTLLGLIDETLSAGYAEIAVLF